MPPQLDILAVGDAMVDVTVRPHESVPGGANPSSILLLPGGLANIAVAARKVGARTGFLGRVGNDIFGDYYEKDLVSNGVLGLLVRSHLPTGICVNFVGKDGERTMYTSQGANRLLASKDLSQETLESTDILFVSGFSMESSETAREIMKIAERCRKTGKRVAVGGGASNLISKRPGTFERLVTEFGDFLIMNEREALALAGEESLEKAKEKIRALCDFTVVTRGSKGSLVLFEGKPRFFKAPKVNAVDTTGAGDVFTGVLLAGIADEMPRDKVIARAHLLASRSVTYPGPRFLPEGSKPK